MVICWILLFYKVNTILVWHFLKTIREGATVDGMRNISGMLAVGVVTPVTAAFAIA
jgi:hypothetical protein